MLKINNREKLLYFNSILKKIIIYKKNIIKKSIIQNSAIEINTRFFLNSKLFSKNFSVRKQCVFSKNKKNISKKTVLSRFILHQIVCLNLNLNFKIYEK